jgi:hypothetical protein
MAQTADDQLASLHSEALVDNAGNVWLPYDMSRLGVLPTGWARLSSRRNSHHAGRRPFHWHAAQSGALHVLNGMGVTLGDSIIGMNALAWLKTRHPTLRIYLYRTPHAPRFVERLYQLASHIIEPVTYLPLPLQTLPEGLVDLSDFVYWPSFTREPMVDFFMRGVGIASQEVPASAKANRWLSCLPVPQVPAPWSTFNYVLFCDQASTPLRTVPKEYAAAMVDRIWHQYGLPVLGFHSISHPHYRDISQHSRNLDQFIAWVKGSAATVATDSSAVHIAAAFDVPTMAVFVSIDPVLRARDYPNCIAVDVRCELTDGLHESDDPEMLREVHRIWGSVVARGKLPWPAPRTESPRV